MGPAHTGPDFGQDPGPDFRGPVFAPVSGDDPATVSGHRIAARLGSDGPGAAGTSYLAYAPGGQPVALTVIRPELAAADGFAARFHHDAQAAARVPGPCIVPVLGSGREGERYWVASAYVPSLSLRTAVERGGPLPTGVVLRLVAALAEGLQAMHHAGVVHGGLRPAHVLLAGDGPRLKGYALAWVAEGAAAGAREPAGDGEAAGGDGAGEGGADGNRADGNRADGNRADEGRADEVRVGEVGEATAFRSPEQAAGKAARAATDVFALGQIAAYASIGVAPFGDGSRVQHAEPDLNELPGQLREIVTRCLIKDPALRPSLAQIATMCAQAAPESRPTSWLPAPLLAAILPAIPPPHFAPPPVKPAGPPPSSPANAPANPPAGRAPSRPEAAPHLPAPPHPHQAPQAQPQQPPSPAGPPPSASDAGAPYPAPAQPPVLAYAGGAHAQQPAGAAGGAPPHGGYLWHPQQWPRAPYVHVPLPLPRKRRKAVGVVAAIAGCAVVATAAVAFAGRSSSGPQSSGAAPSAVEGAPQPSLSPVSPSPTSPPPGGDATGAPQPDSGLVYQQMRLPAGDGLSLRGDPPTLSHGPASGDLGLTADAGAFTVDGTRDTLAVVAAGSPATAATCRSAATGRVTSVATTALSGGARLCVRSVDGAVTALVTFRQMPGRQTPSAAAVFDLTVWHEVVNRSAPGDQFRANFADGVAR
ncbi:Serine/threonine protein kinase [Actinacidiphila yanglinensis]|uniref:Serine/threonine protein kinase n=1 Tax=Actinacidiphila yanglinensis TaxID=310779 RepID=A0A1H5XL02_9ACTN|nr:hypothetical protein [Actinacidiphila yanglinensis]SEG12449.1 Serine/threonine protein kinase [Actinacidiphila yanglinensis]